MEESGGPHTPLHIVYVTFTVACLQVKLLASYCADLSSQDPSQSLFDEDCTTWVECIARPTKRIAKPPGWRWRSRRLPLILP